MVKRVFLYLVGLRFCCECKDIQRVCSLDGIDLAWGGVG